MKGINPKEKDRVPMVTSLVFIKSIHMLLGFITFILIAHKFGATWVTDALFIAQIVPIIFSRQLQRALHVSFLPVFKEHLIKDEEERAWLLANRLFSLVVIVVSLLTILYCLISPFIVLAFAPGSPDDTVQLAVQLTRILSLIIIIISICAIIEAIYNSYNKFLLPSFSVLMVSIGTIFGILFLSDSMGIVGVVIGTMVGHVLYLIIPLFALIVPILTFSKNRFLLGLSMRWKMENPSLKKVIKQIGPVLWGSCLGQINRVIDRTLATLLDVGRVSALVYSFKFAGAIPIIIANSLGKTILPEMSELASNGDIDGLRMKVSRALRMVFVIVLPLTIILMLLSEPFVKIAFEHGAFSSKDTKLVSISLFYYSPAILITSLNVVLMRAFFALQKSYAVAKTSTIAALTNVILSTILMRFMDVGGIALATSLSVLVQLMLLLFLLSKKIGKVISGNALIFSIGTVLLTVTSLALIKYAISWFYIG